MRKEIFYFVCAFIAILPAAAVAREAAFVFIFVLFFYGGWRIRSLSSEKNIRYTGVKALLLFISSNIFNLLLFGSSMGYFLVGVYFNRGFVFIFLFAVLLYALAHKLIKQKWPFFLPFFACFPFVLAVGYFTFSHRSLEGHLSIIKDRRIKPVLTYYKGLKEKTLIVPGADSTKEMEEILFMDASSDGNIFYAFAGNRGKQKGHIYRIPAADNFTHALTAPFPLPADFMIHKDVKGDRLIMLYENGGLSSYDTATFKKLKTVNTRKKGQARKLFDLPYSGMFIIIRDGGRIHTISAESLDIIRGNKIQGFTANVIPNPKQTKIYVTSYANLNVLVEVELPSLNALRRLVSVPWSSVPSFAFCKKRKTFYMMDRLFGSILVVPLFLFDIRDAIRFGKHADMLAYDENKDLLYVASSSTGYVYAFDPVRKKIKDTYFVGKNIRRILVTEKPHNVFVLSHYGIFRIVN